MHDRTHALANLAQWSRTHRDCPSSVLADAYALAGDSSHTFRYLEAALAERDPGLLSVKWDAEYDAIRRDPRYRQIAARLP